MPLPRSGAPSPGQPLHVGACDRMPDGRGRAGDGGASRTVSMAAESSEATARRVASKWFMSNDTIPDRRVLRSRLAHPSAALANGTTRSVWNATRRLQSE